MTSGGVIETGLLPANEKGEFLFEKEVPKNDEVLLAISTDKKITNVYVPKWKKLKERKNEKLLFEDIYRKKDLFKNYVKGDYVIETVNEGSNCKVSVDGNWRHLLIGIWKEEEYQKYLEAKKREDYKKVAYYQGMLQMGSALFYKKTLLTVLFDSINGGSSYLRLIGTIKMSGKEYALVLEKDYYSVKNYNLFTYLYELDENGQGKKIFPLHPVGICNDEDEGC